VSKRRVVVTGLGAITPVGNDVATTWQSLLEGRSGAGPITKFDAGPFAVKFACEVKDFDPHVYMDRKEAKRADLFTQYAVATAVQAMRDAKLEGTTDYDPNRLGVIVGSGIGGLATMEQQHDTYRDRGPSKISPFFIPMFISDIAAGIVSMQFNARGPNYATVSACATSAHAIGDAYRAIQYGDADLMLTGGAEAAGAGAGRAAWAPLTNSTRIPATARLADSITSATRAACSIPSPMSTSGVPVGIGSANPMNAPAALQSRSTVERPIPTPA